MLLRMRWSCKNCHTSGPVDNTTMICGACPICLRHHGEVTYKCEMSPKEFLETLANMSEHEYIANFNAIQECAQSLADDMS